MASIQVPSPQASPLGTPTSPTVFKRIGPYTLLEAIGEGRFGKVYRAQHDVGTLFAVKTAAKAAPRITAEIKVLQQLPAHRNVIRTYCVIESPNNWYIVMELASMTLFQLLDKVKVLDETAARPLMRDIASGLKHCHDNHIAHRDLKLENILIFEREEDVEVRAVLADFGWAYASSPLEDRIRQTFCGSLNYMAPEFFEEQRCYDPYLADVWSLGVVLFAMVSGYLPFESRNKSDLVLEIRRGNPRYPDSISAELKDLLQHTFAVNPSERSSLDFVLDHSWTRTSTQ